MKEPTRELSRCPSLRLLDPSLSRISQTEWYAWRDRTTIDSHCRRIRRNSILLKTTYPITVSTLVFSFGNTKCVGKARRPCRASEIALATKHSTPICEMFRRECRSNCIRHSRPMSKARSRSTVCRVLLRSPSTRGGAWRCVGGERCRERSFWYLRSCRNAYFGLLAARCRFSQRECLSLSFFSVYLLVSSFYCGRDRFVFRKISTRAKITVKYMYIIML